MSYEAGFDTGERAAFAARAEPLRYQRPAQLTSDWDRGFWDGYCPRSASWSACVRDVEEVADEAEA